MATWHRPARARPKLATVFHTTLLRTYKEKAQMLLYRRLFRRSDLLLYVWENQRDHWRYCGLRAAADAVVHNGIDVDHFSTDRTPRHENLRARLGAGGPDYVIGLCSGLLPRESPWRSAEGSRQPPQAGSPRKRS